MKLKHIEPFKKEDLGPIKDNIDWNLAHRIEYLLTEYWDKGIIVNFSIEIYSVPIYKNNGEDVRKFDDLLRLVMEPDEKIQYSVSLNPYGMEGELLEEYFETHKYILDEMKKKLERNYKIEYVYYSWGFYFAKYYPKNN